MMEISISQDDLLALYGEAMVKLRLLAIENERLEAELERLRLQLKAREQNE